MSKARREEILTCKKPRLSRKKLYYKTFFKKVGQKISAAIKNRFECRLRRIIKSCFLESMEINITKGRTRKLFKPYQVTIKLYCFSVLNKKINFFSD